jgi:hypothetical protein
MKAYVRRFTRGPTAALAPFHPGFAEDSARSSRGWKHPMKSLLQKLALAATLLPITSVASATMSDKQPPSAVSPQSQAAQEAKFAAETAARAAAESAASSKALPPELRSTLPSGATSLYLGQFPMSAGGKPLRVHLWAAGRKSSPYTPHQFDPSPFCVDLFQLAGKDDFEPGKWHRVASTVYLGEDGPQDRNDVSMRWLQPAKKQGLVLIVVSPSYIVTRYTVITFPQGISSSGQAKSYTQEFYQGGVGGGKIVYNFGVDKRGFMTVLGSSSYAGRDTGTTLFTWNGREYATTPLRRERK